MTKRETSAAMVLFEGLPQSTRRKLNMTDLKSVTGAILIKDRVQSCFQRQAAEATACRRFKRGHGYCGGHTWCLAYVGFKESLCSNCKRDFQEYRSGVTRYKRRLSAYGQIRAQERALEKAERERLEGGSGS